LLSSNGRFPAPIVIGWQSNAQDHYVGIVKSSDETLIWRTFDELARLYQLTCKLDLSIRKELAQLIFNHSYTSRVHDCKVLREIISDLIDSLEGRKDEKFRIINCRDDRVTACTRSGDEFLNLLKFLGFRQKEPGSAGVEISMEWIYEVAKFQSERDQMKSQLVAFKGKCFYV